MHLNITINHCKSIPHWSVKRSALTQLRAEKRGMTEAIPNSITGTIVNIIANLVGAGLLSLPATCELGLEFYTFLPWLPPNPITGTFT